MQCLHPECDTLHEDYENGYCEQHQKVCRVFTCDNRATKGDYCSAHSNSLILKVTPSDLAKIVLALNMRSKMLHNFADEHLGSDTALQYREAGNSYSALAIKLNHML